MRVKVTLQLQRCSLLCICCLCPVFKHPNKCSVLLTELLRDVHHPPNILWHNLFMDWILVSTSCLCGQIPRHRRSPSLSDSASLAQVISEFNIDWVVIEKLSRIVFLGSKILCSDRHWLGLQKWVSNKTGTVIPSVLGQLQPLSCPLNEGWGLVWFPAVLGPCHGEVESLLLRVPELLHGVGELPHGELGVGGYQWWKQWVQNWYGKCPAYSLY